MPEVVIVGAVKRPLRVVDHAELIARFVRVGQKIKIFASWVMTQHVLHIAKCTEILCGKPDAVKKGNLLVRGPPLGSAGSAPARTR